MVPTLRVYYKFDLNGIDSIPLRATILYSIIVITGVNEQLKPWTGKKAF